MKFSVKKTKKKLYKSIINENGDEIATVWAEHFDNVDDVEATARLFSVAHELLEALEEIFARSDDMLSEWLCEFEIRDARSAIAKAKGE